MLPSIVIFAQIPPPEHGQSRMVMLALEALRGRTQEFEVHHINARFSTTLEQIGEGSIGKFFLVFRYLIQAVRLRSTLNDPLLYYIPGPVKWSAVVRDWILLLGLRLFYRRVVFHWHAIGQGEWAHGSDRLMLPGPSWLDRLSRRVSAAVLHRPYASISVSPTSTKDADAVASQQKLVVCNGIEDPCPDFDSDLGACRRLAIQAIASAEHPRFRILYLSHGTVEKGLFDALEALRIMLTRSDPSWSFDVTFAGGVSKSCQPLFSSKVETLRSDAGERLKLVLSDYVTGETKSDCYRGHDIFLVPSHWESFGLTVVEAMAHGMQVVACASDGVRGILPIDHPYLAPVRDTTNLAECLLRCCKDLRQPLLMSEASAAMRQRFLDHFQITGFRDHFISAIHDLSLATCSGGVSSSLDTHTPEKPATVIDRSNSADDSTVVPLITDHGSLGTRLPISVYLADQNPKHDRSFGISRMSQVVLAALQRSGKVSIRTITARNSQQAPEGIERTRVLPWSTRGKRLRFLTDHLHPLFGCNRGESAIHYYPKGYLPLLSGCCRPSVVTIHDTIIQHDDDHYPEWRKPWEYAYWNMMLKHTLRRADRVLTVSESARGQIEDFMRRHRIPMRDITVTYEPCLYEDLPQPVAAAKENYVIHLASCEPHKRTAHLVRWWHRAEMEETGLPMLHLIGTAPPEVYPLLADSHSIVKSPFLEDHALQDTYRRARALVLPSEIEGFGLPALEAYYLGTPVCFVKGTSVEEVLSVATHKGGFHLDDADSLHAALGEVMDMTPEEIHTCGMVLRETYAADKVAARMMEVFQDVATSKR